jgi:hypothetical protein
VRGFFCARPAFLYLSTLRIIYKQDALTTHHNRAIPYSKKKKMAVISSVISRTLSETIIKRDMNTQRAYLEKIIALCKAVLRASVIQANLGPLFFSSLQRRQDLLMLPAQPWKHEEIRSMRYDTPPYYSERSAPLIYHTPICHTAKKPVYHTPRVQGSELHVIM